MINIKNIVIYCLSAFIIFIISGAYGYHEGVNRAIKTGVIENEGNLYCVVPANITIKVEK